MFKPSLQGVSKAVAASGAAAIAASLLLSAAPASADFRLPPIDPDPKRCDRGYVGNTIGQANAVSDKVRGRGTWRARPQSLQVACRSPPSPLIKKDA